MRDLPSNELLHPGVAHDENVLEDQHEAVENDADETDQDHRHEHAGGIERALDLDHQVAEPPLRGDELADDGAGDAALDVEPPKMER